MNRKKKISESTFFYFGKKYRNDDIKKGLPVASKYGTINRIYKRVYQQEVVMSAITRKHITDCNCLEKYWRGG